MKSERIEEEDEIQQGTSPHRLTAQKTSCDSLISLCFIAHVCVSISDKENVTWSRNSSERTLFLSGHHFFFISFFTQGWLSPRSFNNQPKPRCSPHTPVPYLLRVHSCNQKFTNAINCRSSRQMMCWFVNSSLGKNCISIILDIQHKK